MGTIIGPSIGGYFANPTESFPGMFPQDSLFSKFPYLLPNLICAFMLLCSMVAAYVFLFETHPDMQPWSSNEDLQHSTADTPLLPTSAAMANAPANISQQSYGTFDQIRITDSNPMKPFGERKSFSRSSSINSVTKFKTFNTQVVMLIISLGM
jgi:hypothetical protein